MTLFELEREPGPFVFNRHHRNAPEGAKYIGRGTPFGNPFAIGDIDPETGHAYNRRQVLEKYEAWVRSQPELVELIKRELRGEDLLCSCKPAPCHGDILLLIANS